MNSLFRFAFVTIFLSFALLIPKNSLFCASRSQQRHVVARSFGAMVLSFSAFMNIVDAIDGLAGESSENIASIL